MVTCLRKILKTLTQRQKKQILLLEMLLVMQGILEVFGFSAIVTFIMLILDIEGTSQNRIFQMIHKVLPFSDYRYVFAALSVILLACFLAKYLSALLAKYILRKVVYENESRLIQRLYRKYIFWPYERFFDASSYGFQKKIVNDPRGYSRILETMLVWVGEMVKACIIMGVLMSINWKITLLIVVGGVFVAWLYTSVFVKWSRRLGEDRDELFKTQAKQLNQSFTGIREIILDGKQEYHARMFAQQTQAYNHAEQIFSVLSDLPWIFFEAIGIMGALAFITLVLLLVEQPAQLLSQISVFALLVVKVMPSIQKTVSAKTVVNYYRAPFDAIVNELEETENTDCPEAALPEDVSFDLNREILIENVSYKYPSGEEEVLRNVNLKVEKGSFIGISGVSGSGKSTLIDIVCGLLRPAEGRVLVDGVDISQNLHAWRKKVAYIPQNVFLFEDTLKHNIAPNIPDEEIDNARMMDAIRSAQLEDVVSQLPCGLDEPLGERGIRLSGGQCQRIAIARALYRESRLLVLDEATSSLDPKTEQEVLRALELLKGKVTVISVAHRETALRACDFRFVVDKGMVTRYEE